MHERGELRERDDVLHVGAVLQRGAVVELTEPDRSQRVNAAHRVGGARWRVIKQRDHDQVDARTG